MDKRLKPCPFCKSKQKALEACNMRASEWIPVSEKLPPVGEPVLAAVKYEDYPLCASLVERKGRVIFVADDREIQCRGDGWIYKPELDVTHWQPLPELPKKE